MKLQFSPDKIKHWADQYRDKYDQGDQEDKDLIAQVPQVRECGFLTLKELRLVARWKSPRSARYIERNDDEYVKAVTGFALQTENERARIEVLTVLDGVCRPTASLILHFFHTAKYPVLDYRALWSVGVEVPAQYDFKFWWEYVECCRGVAAGTHHDMRTLDRALWAYSKENQP
jgi:hypothetical protein